MYKSHKINICFHIVIIIIYHHSLLRALAAIINTFHALRS